MTSADAHSAQDTGRGRIDWVAARQAYLDLGSARTFSAVAKQFGVSDTAVRNHAHKNGWKEAGIEFDRRIAAGVEEKRIRTRVQRVTKILRVVDLALDRYEDEIASLDLKLSDVPGLAKVAELLEGEATDRVELGEVQQVIRAVFLVAGRYVPKETRDEFLQELERATSGLSALARPELEAAA